MTGNKITIFKVSFFVDFILCSVFKSSLNHNYLESPSFCASISGLHWWPVFGTIGCSFDYRCKGTKIFGIYQIFACDKERFSAKHLRFETSLKNGLYFLWGVSLCFCGIENYVLRYKSAYYEVIPDYRETYSVFSIQFFSLLLPPSV